ncbi:hypothetical protein ACO0LD_03255 [Undibacterium sp. Ji83W]|uniref:hypothetical protein n=1 Tax=Undibacterium sp. Ji83W TaxID=3413043 RepID=UPI003BF28D68
MKSALQVIEEKLDTKEKPTYDELEAALLQALKERNGFRDAVKGMAGWLGRLVHAHVSLDDARVKSTLDAFMAERVQVVQAATNQIH